MTSITTQGRHTVVSVTLVSCDQNAVSNRPTCARRAMLHITQHLPPDFALSKLHETHACKHVHEDLLTQDNAAALHPRHEFSARAAVVFYTWRHEHQCPQTILNS
ncbi:unnamed protein product [Ectocarpus sp. 8 AP-2014]